MGTIKFKQQILAAAKDIKRRIVFSDGNDLRLAHALKTFLKLNSSQCILVGNEKEIIEKLKSAGINSDPSISIIDPCKSVRKKEYKDILRQSFKSRNKTVEKDMLDALILDNSFYSALMLKNDDADCGIAGSLSSTEKQMRAIINVLGIAEGSKYLSGAMIEEVPGCKYGSNGIFLLADVAIIPEPDEKQLLDIVLSSYRTAKSFFKRKPKVAVLSYSTMGSAKSSEIEKIKRVIEKARGLNSEIDIDGELQFDAAIVPEVSGQKSPDSILKGNANVLIFPNLNAANIGCKIIHRLAKARVYGTIIQGAAKPFNDLSRGCSSEDIVMLSAMTLLQLIGMEGSAGSRIFGGPKNG